MKAKASGRSLAAPDFGVQLAMHLHLRENGMPKEEMTGSAGEQLYVLTILWLDWRVVLELRRAAGDRANCSHRSDRGASRPAVLEQSSPSAAACSPRSKFARRHCSPENGGEGLDRSGRGDEPDGRAIDRGGGRWPSATKTAGGIFFAVGRWSNFRDGKRRCAHRDRRLAVSKYSLEKR